LGQRLHTSASYSRLRHFLLDFSKPLRFVTICEEIGIYVAEVHMKRLMYLIIPLSAIAVLVFATIAAAQSVLPENQAHSHDSSQPAVAPAETTAPVPNSAMTVNIHDHAFDPAQLNVAPGTTVTFVNNDTEPHTATADNGLFDTGVLEPGYSFDVFFDGTGTVTYHCELHPDMQGSIVVGEASEADEEGGTNPPNQAVSVWP
jgi:plastocyanin